MNHSCGFLLLGGRLKLQTMGKENYSMNRVRWSRYLLLMLIFSLPLLASAQDINAKSPEQDKHSTKQQTRAEKKKEQQRIRAENSESENIRHAQQIQTKEVRKRMKKSRKEADQWNAHHKEFFLWRWFRKKN